MQALEQPFARFNADQANVAYLQSLLCSDGHAKEVKLFALGRMLVDTCINFARGAGYKTLQLWTNDVLVSARRIYQAAGFTLIEEEKHHSFGKDLVGQTWELKL